MTRVIQEHPNLTVLNPAGSAAVLSLHPGRMLPLLDKARFINDQHSVSIANMLYHIFT